MAATKTDPAHGPDRGASQNCVRQHEPSPSRHHPVSAGNAIMSDTLHELCLRQALSPSTRAPGRFEFLLVQRARVPVTLVSVAISTCGVSTIFSALTTIPFLRSETVAGMPLTMNL
jgi:hypothetical protein